MAKATAICTCSKCGKEFEIIKRNCYNRKAADNFENWAIDNITMCYQCEQIEKQKKNNEEKGITIPDFLDGKYWNEKIYGYGEKKSIYIDGKKYNLSREEIDELQKYLELKNN